MEKDTCKIAFHLKLLFTHIEYRILAVTVLFSITGKCLSLKTKCARHKFSVSIGMFTRDVSIHFRVSEFTGNEY